MTILPAPEVDFSSNDRSKHEEDNLLMQRISLPLLTALLAGSFAMSGSSDAADRRVLIEQFTATWCGPCRSVGRATIDILEDYPDTVTGFQCHGSDDYTIAWGNSRMNFYGVGGTYPTVWMDGWWSQVGSYGTDSGNYSALMGGVNASLARSTDVTIGVVATENSYSEYEINWNIGVEAGGQDKTVYVHAVQVLDIYPTSENHYYNCVIQAAPQETLNLVAGESVQVQQNFTLSGASLQNKDDVHYICWVQAVSGSSPAQIHNSIIHKHDPTPPSTVTVAIDGSGNYTSIQDAIDDVGTYSTINIMPGTYEEHLDFGGRNLTLTGIAGAESTIVDGTSSGIVLTLQTNENESTLIEGLTFTNGQYSLGSGVRCNSNPRFRNCVISNNNANAIVAGLVSSGDIGPMLENVYFCNNTVGDDQAHIWGDWVDGGGVVFEDDCEVAPCDGDFNGDTTVGVDDLLAVIAGWQNPYTVDDLLQVIANWGSDC